MFVKFTGVDRVPIAVNATQISFISYSEEGTRIRFGEGRKMGVIAESTRHDDTIHPLRQKHGDIACLMLQIFGCAADERLVSLLEQRLLDRLREDPEERHVDGRKHEADDTARAATQHAGILAGRVVQVAHGLFNARSHIWRDIAGLVERARHCRNRRPCPPCDVLDACFQAS